MNLHLGKKIGLCRTTGFALLTVYWFLFGSFFLTQQTSPGLFWAWALLSSLFSMILLSAVGYFDRNIPKPELSGLMSLLLTFPVSAFLAKWLLMLTSHIPPIRYSKSLRAALWVAIIFELSQWVIFKVHLARGKKWSLVTHLHPDEFKILCAQIERSGATPWIDVRPYDRANTNGGRIRGDETLVISRRAAHHLQSCDGLLSAHLRGQRIVDFTQLLKEFRGRVSLHNSDGWSFLMGSKYQSFPIRFYFYVKEFFEVLLAIFLLVLFSPLLLTLSVLIYVKSGGPVLYRQQRLGFRGKQFSLYKFRTMPVTAESSGPQWAREDDPRVTPLGRWLRKTRLDELPQLMNVISGDLSFVGPRPERPEFYKTLNEQIPLFSMRLWVRPGITGWAQVRHGYAASVEESKTKLEYDLYYVQNMSPRLDFRVLINTAALMLRGNSGR